MGKRTSRLGSLTAFVVLVGLTYRYGTPEQLGVLGYGLLGLLALKLLLAMFYRPYRAPSPGRRSRAGGAHARPETDHDVAVIVPIYNEDPEILRRCLVTILEQTRPPQTVMVVDDGSTSQEAADLADTMVGAFAHRGIRLLVLRQPHNMGKREALARGFTTVPEADIYVGVDSDTVLASDALAELLIPMADESVTAITGMVLASNYRVNVLTRLIELRYANAFLYERAAYSMLGTVLCCCGSLAAYRGRVVHKYLEDFRTQTFLGRPAVVGDDRRLTNYCLLEGRVLLQTSAIAETAVPERLGHYLRQQSRWNRSFFRETMWCLKTFPFRRPTGFLLSSIEFLSWMAFTTMLVYSLVIYPVIYGEMVFDEYSTTLVMFGYLRSVRYLDLPRPGVGVFEKLAVFSLAPMYGLMHIFMLLPVRLWSLATLRTAAWGTRKAVEVSLEREPAGPTPASRDNERTADLHRHQLHLSAFSGQWQPSAQQSGPVVPVGHPIPEGTPTDSAKPPAPIGHHPPAPSRSAMPTRPTMPDIPAVRLPPVHLPQVPPQAATHAVRPSALEPTPLAASGSPYGPLIFEPDARGPAQEPGLGSGGLDSAGSDDPGGDAEDLAYWSTLRRDLGA